MNQKEHVEGEFKVDRESSTVWRIETGGREIILVGTAHVSPESVEEVCRLIREEHPDRVCVEIDEGRYQSIIKEDSWKEMDISKVLRKGQAFLVITNLILSSFQKKIGKNIGIKPGEEMKKAIDTAKEENIPFSLSDRPIQTTLLRAWRVSNFWNKMKLLASLLAALFSSEEPGEEEIEALKETDAMQSMMKELADHLPSVKKVLIDERDQYLATKIFEAEGTKILAVVGAGHAPGMVEWLQGLDDGSRECNVDEISLVPPKGRFSRILPWLIPVAVAGLILFGIFTYGWNMGLQMSIIWVLANGILAALGALIALAHPLTILLSFIAAPITSLNPTIGVGMVAGLLEWFFRKPRVRDLEHLQEDVLSLKGWYRNRVSRILLVFFFSSLGSSIGTFYAIPRLSIMVGS